MKITGEKAREVYKLNGFQGPDDCDLYETLIIPEDFQPTEEKIQMTVEEKKEFDELKENSSSLYGAMEYLGDVLNSCLYTRLFENKTIEENNKAQLEFSRAWENPSLIEVIESEHEFKVGDLVKETFTNRKAVIISICEDMDHPLKISYENGAISWLKKEDALFIKSNAVNWEDPSLIEVEKKKYRIKLADGYLVNVMGDWLTLKNKKDGDIFTQAGLDEMQALQKFRAVDLNKCKEEVGK